MEQFFSISPRCPMKCGATVIFLDLHEQDDVLSLLRLPMWHVLVSLCAPWLHHVIWDRFIHQAKGYLWTSVRSFPFISKCPQCFVGQIAYFIWLSTACQKKLLSVKGIYCHSTDKYILQFLESYISENIFQKNKNIILKADRKEIR